jgi:hypothetical protein
MDKKGISSTVIGAVITGIFGVVATLGGIYFKNSLDQRKAVTPAPSPQVQTAVPTHEQGKTVTPAPSLQVQTTVPTHESGIRTTQAIIINGQEYFPPAGQQMRCAAADRTDDSKNGVRYKVTIPDGWLIVWVSLKASWPGGSYENNGLVGIYGSWAGTVTAVNGEYCAVPVEWSQYAIDQLRGSSLPQQDRPEFYVNKP